eukprot:TRINITY_DN5799_c0_g1_i1.p1 TRINITY_DN5799_c0_g1~~TRINITY_DN5799_c0_g1_i1.p1  ORF type:complete len:258 (-),score=129.43 TRINITY_DN5799_c0_g1_i1:162-935(-)
MPPKRFKTNHRKGLGEGKSIEDIEARNRQINWNRDHDEEPPRGGGGGYNNARPAQAKGSGRGQAESSSEEESSEEEKPKLSTKKDKKATGTGGLEVQNPNRDSSDKGGEVIELSRKQREEIERQAARRRYEELHKAGKTDEAKADLSRLEEVKKRREEAAKKRADEQAEKDAKEATKKTGMSKELKDALGGEATRMRGERSQANKEKATGEKMTKKGQPDLFGFVKSEDIASAEVKAYENKKDGTIDGCRAAEEDFM